MYSTHNQTSKNAISEEKMEKIIDTILQGQYSQACLLLLEATSRNPLHYIPYRTYNRIQKQRQQVAPHMQLTATAKPLKPRIADLDYIENLSEKPPSIHGGQCPSLESGVVRWPYAHIHNCTPITLLKSCF